MVATLSQHEMLIPVNTHAEKNTIGGVLLNPDLFMGIATLLHVDDFLPSPAPDHLGVDDAAEPAGAAH